MLDLTNNVSRGLEAALSEFSVLDVEFVTRTQFGVEEITCSKTVLVFGILQSGDRESLFYMGFIRIKLCNMNSYIYSCFSSYSHSDLCAL